MVTEETHLNLAHKNLKNIPKALVNSLLLPVTTVDASNNSISDVSFLGSLSNLTSVILDHNAITSDTVFPYMPSVRTLWLNYNLLQGYPEFIKHLQDCFPHLKHLSLMGNPGIPTCSEDTYYDYLRYRLYVISKFDELEYLDDRAVVDHEREEADRLFGKDIFKKFVSKSVPKLFQAATNRLVQYITPSSDGRSYLI